MATASKHTPTSTLDRSALTVLMRDHAGPCVSIYLPTNKNPFAADENRIRFKDQLKQVNASLNELDDHPDQVAEIRKNLEPIAEDQDLFKQVSNGLAVFASGDTFAVHPLPRAVPEIAVVAETFHVTPLIRLLSRNDRFHILAVSVGDVALYEATADSIERLDLAGLPKDLEDALNEYKRHDPPRSQYDPESSEGRDDQVRRYFRRIDKIIVEKISNPSQRPLVLAALPQWQAAFRAVSHNNFLVEKGVDRDPFKDISPDQLRQEAWPVIEKTVEQRARQAVEAYENARPHGQGISGLDAVGKAAAYGQIDTLLLQADHQVGGRLDLETGEIHEKPLEHPSVDDVLDDIAERVIRTEGKVMVLEPDHMPEGTQVAAVLRYPPGGRS